MFRLDIVCRSDRNADDLVPNLASQTTRSRSSRCSPIPRPMAASRSSASTPMPPRCSSPASARSRSSARCAFRSSIIPRWTKRKAACEAEIAVNRPFAPEIYRGVVPITREADGRLALGGDGTPVEWAVEMRRFDETATLDHLADAGKDRRRARRRARPRGRGRACRWRPRSKPRPGSRRSPTISSRTTRHSARRPSCFRPPRSTPLPRQPRRATRASVRFCRARAARPHPPHPRRSASRQYRADRRPAGAVRRHRVRPAHRLRRRALRSRLPADGPGRARAWPRGQHRAQPLPHRDPARRGPRRAGGAAVLPVDAGGDPRQGDGGAARARAADDARRSRAPRATISTWRGASSRRRRRMLVAVGGLSGTGKSVLARALAPELRAAPGAVVLRSDVERKALFGKRRARQAAARRLHAGGDARGSMPHRRQGAPRGRGRPFGHRRCGVRAPTGTRRRSSSRPGARRAVPRPVPRRRSRDPPRPRRHAPARRLRRRRGGARAAGAATISASSTGRASTPPARRRRRWRARAGRSNRRVGNGATDHAASAQPFSRLPTSRAQALATGDELTCRARARDRPRPGRRMASPCYPAPRPHAASIASSFRLGHAFRTPASSPSRPPASAPSSISIRRRRCCRRWRANSASAPPRSAPS